MNFRVYRSSLSVIIHWLWNALSERNCLRSKFSDYLPKFNCHPLQVIIVWPGRYFSRSWLNHDNCAHAPLGVWLNVSVQVHSECEYHHLFFASIAVQLYMHNFKSCTNRRQSSCCSPSLPAPARRQVIYLLIYPLNGVFFFFKLLLGKNSLRYARPAAAAIAKVFAKVCQTNFISKFFGRAGRLRRSRTTCCQNFSLQRRLAVPKT